MNEQIRKITDELFSMEEFEYAEEFLNDAFMEKFAELIVRECIMICKSHKIQSTEDVWYLAHNETVNNISENIEEYFGVEP